MRLRTFVGIFVEEERSDESDTPTEIACNTPKNKADLLVWSEGACFFEEAEDDIFSLLIFKAAGSFIIFGDEALKLLFLHDDYVNFDSIEY